MDSVGPLAATAAGAGVRVWPIAVGWPDDAAAAESGAEPPPATAGAEEEGPPAPGPAEPAVRVDVSRLTLRFHTSLRVEDWGPPTARSLGGRAGGSLRPSTAHSGALTVRRVRLGTLEGEGGSPSLSLESHYALCNAARRVGSTRYATAAGAIAAAVVSLNGESPPAYRLAQLAVALPFLAAAFALTFWPAHFARHFERASCAAILALSFSQRALCVFMYRPSPHFLLTYLIVMWGACSLIGLRFHVSAWISLVLMLESVWPALVANLARGEPALAGLSLLEEGSYLSGALLAVGSSYLRDRTERRLFFQELMVVKAAADREGLPLKARGPHEGPLANGEPGPGEEGGAPAAQERDLEAGAGEAEGGAASRRLLRPESEAEERAASRGPPTSPGAASGGGRRARPIASGKWTPLDATRAAAAALSSAEHGLDSGRARHGDSGRSRLSADSRMHLRRRSHCGTEASPRAAADFESSLASRAGAGFLPGSPAPDADASPPPRPAAGIATRMGVANSDASPPTRPWAGIGMLMGGPSADAPPPPRPLNAPSPPPGIASSLGTLVLDGYPPPAPPNPDESTPVLPFVPPPPISVSSFLSLPASIAAGGTPASPSGGGTSHASTRPVSFKLPEALLSRSMKKKRDKGHSDGEVGYRSEGESRPSVASPSSPRPPPPPPPPRTLRARLRRWLFGAPLHPPEFERQFQEYAADFIWRRTRMLALPLVPLYLLVAVAGDVLPGLEAGQTVERRVRHARVDLVLEVGVAGAVFAAGTLLLLLRPRRAVPVFKFVLALAILVAQTTRLVTLRRLILECEEKPCEEAALFPRMFWSKLAQVANLSFLSASFWMPTRVHMAKDLGMLAVAALALFATNFSGHVIPYVNFLVIPSLMSAVACARGERNLRRRFCIEGGRLAEGRDPLDAEPFAAADGGG